MKLVDSHCHLDGQKFEADRAAVIERALAAGVERMVAIGTGDGPPDLEAGIRLADKYECMFATVGVHPHDAGKADGSTPKRLRELLRHSRVVAMGEIGLDYHYDLSPRDVQQRVFIEQLEVARDAGVPVVIHTREAWADTFAILEEHWRPAGIPGIMHCFSGGPEEARRALSLGFYLSFSGILTYPKASDVQQAAKDAPLDRILVETDAPYLAPVPNRGKRNEPSFLVHTVQKLADLRGEPVETIAAATTANWVRICLPGTRANG